MCIVSRTEAARWEKYFQWKRERVDKDQWLTASIVQAIEKLFNATITAPGHRITPPPRIEDLLLKFERPDPAKAAQQKRQTIDSLPMKDRILLMQSVLCAMTGQSLSGGKDTSDGIRA